MTDKDYCSNCHMDVQTEFLRILQDFVPCWGRCPATLCDFVTSKKQGKGTADLMMPFGDWFLLVSLPHPPESRGVRPRLGKGCAVLAHFH